MHTVVLGEDEEYGKRLIKYLEARLEESVRILGFTDPERLIWGEEQADCYVFGEDFFHRLMEKEERWKTVEPLILTELEEEGTFCRYHSPKKLAAMIRDKLRLQEDHKGITTGKDWMTAVFSPVFEPCLRRAAKTFMQPGDLYLGMEDVVSGTEDKNMSDLCYYVRLRTEDIIRHVKEAARQDGDIFYLDSPNLYFDLLELEEEDYRWFFTSLKKEGGYGHLFAGAGCGIAGHKGFLRLFDRMILLDSRENIRQHRGCELLERMISSSGQEVFKGSCSRICREDILYGTAE